MNDIAFKESIYKPYNEAWKVLKLIQYADQTDNTEEQWQRYMKEIDRLAAAYPGNKFVDKLITLLLDAGDVIAKMNGGINEVQT